VVVVPTEDADNGRLLPRADGDPLAHVLEQAADPPLQNQNFIFRSKSYDPKLQRQRCEKLPRHE
jgi:hypothetical protein